MKQVFLLAILFSGPSLWAQQTFSLSPNPVFGEYVDDYITEGRATVKNLSATTDTFKWTRTIILLENDSVCETQVTDPYNHWHPMANNKNFILEPNQEGPFYVALWDFQLTGCCAIVHMKVKKLSGTPDSIEAYYYLKTCQPLDVSSIGKSEIKLFPNPASHYFGLQNAETVHQMVLCDATGRFLRRIPANAENRYELQGLPTGAYYLVLENKEEAIIQVLEFVKG